MRRLVTGNMKMPANEDFWSLTAKEKQTLRLIVRGHDAKSIARDLDLSVHTINERLRDARRKMAVSSSREAARLLLEAEGEGGSPIPHSSVDRQIGEDRDHAPADQGAAPSGGAGRASRRPWIIIGVCLMTFALGLLALAGLSQITPQITPQITGAPPAPAGTDATPDAAVVDAARHWLELGDQGRCDDAYPLTGTAFRKLNTAQVWRHACQTVRLPLGALVSRTLLSEEELPAPPHGYQVVKFRTSFANKADTVETVTLDREGGAWRVVGVTVG